MNLSGLNDKQYEAATCTEGPLLILAGAGSGKTQTMTHRIAYLVEQGVSPYEILAVTFTNKAAKEMRDRVEKLIGPVPGAWIMTFHSMCLRMLRGDGELLGYEKNFSVYDTSDTKTLLKNVLKGLNVDDKMYPQNYVATVISHEKEADRDPDEYLAQNGWDYRSKMIRDIYAEYQSRLKKNNAMDFDDLLVNCLHLLRDNPGVLDYYHKRFKYIMVDEYQDTNHIQYELVRLLSRASRNICVVGDDDQCIYQWRGADIANILSFEEDFKDARVVKLEQNYRSTGYILDAAFSVIKHNKARKDKRLWTDKSKGEKIVYRRTDNEKSEAEYIARRIRLLQGDYGYGDIAVLYRMNAQSRVLEDALRRSGIPYQVLSGLSFYERKETKDMMSYMRLLVNPTDDISLMRIINEPKRGMGKASLERLSELAEEGDISLYHALQSDEYLESLTPKPKAAMRELLAVLEGLRAEAENLKVSDIYDALLNKTGYLNALKEEKTLEAESRLENLLDFKSFIVDYEKDADNSGETADLSGFLERCAINSDQDNYDEEAGKVTLMTIHGAKGLEFPVVFIPGMEDGLFPGSRGMADEDDMEEERRLCYVGITRAKERLFLSGAEYRVLFGKGNYTRESTFLRELDPRVLDETGDSIYRGSTRVQNNLGIDTGSLDGFSAAPVRPFASLKSAIVDVEKKAMEKDFSVGDRVRHNKFGEGLVIDVDSSTVTVIFDSEGQKHMAKGYAPMEKIHE